MTTQNEGYSEDIVKQLQERIGPKQRTENTFNEIVSTSNRQYIGSILELSRITDRLANLENAIKTLKAKNFSSGQIQENTRK